MEIPLILVRLKRECPFWTKDDTKFTQKTRLFELNIGAAPNSYYTDKLMILKNVAKHNSRAFPMEESQLGIRFHLFQTERQVDRPLPDHELIFHLDITNISGTNVLELQCYSCIYTTNVLVQRSR